MSLRIRRGTDAQRQTTLLDQGELAYTTDTQKLFIGDGASSGGVNVLSSAAGTGLIFDHVTQTLKVSGSNTIVEADAAPSLGGTLNLNSHNIIGTGNITISGNIGATGNIGTNGSLYSSGLTISGNSSLALSSSNVSTLNVTGITTGVNGGIPTVAFSSSKGTLSSPVITGPGDQLFVVSFRGFVTGSPNKNTVSTALISSWDSGATMTNSTPGGVFKIGVPNNNSGFNFVTFTGISGVLSCPISSTTVYSSPSHPLPSASIVGKGARAFVSDATTNTFGSTYTSGGTYNVPVWTDGTTWYIG